MRRKTASLINTYIGVINMLDFEDVTPRKRTTDENNEIKEQIESIAEDIKNETIEESAAMQPETCHCNRRYGGGEALLSVKI